MRVVRSLLLLLSIASAAAGCAQQPVAYMAYPGIDSMAYGGAPAMAQGGYGYGYGSYAPSPYGGLYGYAGGGAPAGLGGYTLDSGDRLRVVVFGQEGLTNSYLVGASGFIDMPLIGSVPARGVTSDQLAGRIAEKLRDGFIREPHVAVEVAAPGQYPYVANMTAETAIAIAGGFTPRAQRKSVIITRNYYGQQTRIAVPMTFPLRPGDTVNVQERWF
jgi:polysaccharide export outer membrane protein